MSRNVPQAHRDDRRRDEAQEATSREQAGVQTEQRAGEKHHAKAPNRTKPGGAKGKNGKRPR
ncbi:hypothetical protein [Rhizocola hellebori]|nr:hypothetical protein [Rhizocola hellebori]